MLAYLNINLEQVRSEESGLRCEFSKLKDQCDKLVLLKNTEFSFNLYQTLTTDITKLEQIIKDLNQTYFNISQKVDGFKNNHYNNMLDTCIQLQNVYPRDKNLEDIQITYRNREYSS